MYAKFGCLNCDARFVGLSLALLVVGQIAGEHGSIINVYNLFFSFVAAAAVVFSSGCGRVRATAGPVHEHYEAEYWRLRDAADQNLWQ